MNTIGKLLIVLALCMTLTDCALSPIYPITITATAATGQVHTTTIYVQFVGLGKLKK